jgi:hypothetical protein
MGLPADLRISRGSSNVLGIPSRTKPEERRLVTLSPEALPNDWIRGFPDVAAQSSEAVPASSKKYTEAKPRALSFSAEAGTASLLWVPLPRHRATRRRHCQRPRALLLRSAERTLRVPLARERFVPQLRDHLRCAQPGPPSSAPSRHHAATHQSTWHVDTTSGHLRETRRLAGGTPTLPCTRDFHRAILIFARRK